MISLLRVLVAAVLFPVAAQGALGREKAAFDLTQETTAAAEIPRQDLCRRYEQVRSGNITLREALSGLQLRPIMRVGKFFNYNEETGIDPEDPGLLASMVRIFFCVNFFF